MLCKIVVFKDLSVGLMKVVYVLIVFVTGIVVGLMSSSHVDRYFTTQPYSLDRIRASASLDSMYKSSVTNDRNCSIRSSGVGSCVREDCLSMESFRSPKNLSHHMTDEELFWRGSLVPEKKEYPFDRMPKIAFMFLTRGRLPFVPLLERFFKGQDVRKYSIYVHTDPMFELGVANTSVFYKRQIPSQAVKWGSVSLVDAERRLLGNALLDFSNERYLDSYDDPSKYGRGRYSRHMKPDIRLRDWRKGSQWFEMNRELAIKIISDTKYYNLFRKYCTEDCYPDEHYMPTFVHMFHGSLNADRTVTYVDWSIGGPHPKSFGPKDITDSFMKSLRNNGTTCSFNKGTTPICYLFARKFNETALEPLLKLDSEVLGY